jgi:hypothetical protein
VLAIEGRALHQGLEGLAAVRLGVEAGHVPPPCFALQSVRSLRPIALERPDAMRLAKDWRASPNLESDDVPQNLRD